MSFWTRLPFGFKPKPKNVSRDIIRREYSPDVGSSQGGLVGGYTSPSRFNPDQIQRLLQIARNEVGVHEVGGNNRGERIREYQRATWIDVSDNPPWCACFVCWCIQKWVKENPDLPKFKVPRTPRAFELEDWGRSQGFQILPNFAKARAGDIIIFNFSHVGFVNYDEVDDEDIKTIEGNTHSGTLASDSAGGDSVCFMKRPPRLVRCLVRLL